MFFWGFIAATVSLREKSEKTYLQGIVDGGSRNASCGAAASGAERNELTRSVMKFSDRKISAAPPSAGQLWV